MGATTPERITLIQEAARSKLSNCFDWLDEDVIAVVRQRTDLRGLTPNSIKELACRWIVDHNGPIFEHKETREEWKGRREFWYGVIVPIDPVDDFPRGLFVEMELEDPPDPEYPAVALLNAHPETKGPRLDPKGVLLS